MIGRRVFAIVAATAGTPAVCNAQVAGSTPSVTLDQVAQPNAANRAVEIEMAQPGRLPREAAVTSSEIAARPGDRSPVVAAIGGVDRCDPAGAPEASALCRQRLETRAGRYARPAPAPITSEGRLLLLVNPNGMADAGNVRDLGTLSIPNGPAQQLAGALRGQSAQESDADAATRGSIDPTKATNGLPPVVVLPTK